MENAKQLSFGFVKKERDTAWLGKHLQRCKRLTAVLLVAQMVVSIGRVWILAH